MIINNTKWAAGGLPGSAGRCQQGFIYLFIKDAGPAGRVCFSWECAAFSVHGEGHEYGHNRAFYICLCCCIYILTSLLLALAASISVVLIDLYIIPTACCRRTHTLRLFRVCVCVCVLGHVVILQLLPAG